MVGLSLYVSPVIYRPNASWDRLQDKRYRYIIAGRRLKLSLAAGEDVVITITRGSCYLKFALRTHKTQFQCE